MKTTWKKGSVVTVGWGMAANHGGGYQYRLCKLPPGHQISTKLYPKSTRVQTMEIIWEWQFFSK